MPLQGEYTWNEKKDTIKCMIPLKGASPASVDIFVTATTLKVNYAPYLIDIILLHSIDPNKHKATIKEGILIITLYKNQSFIWGSIVSSSEVSKDEVIEIRKKATSQHEENEKILNEQRADRKITDERYSLRKQMALDENERSRLENLKQEEKETAEKEMYETFAQINQQQLSTTAVPSTFSSISPPSTFAKQQVHHRQQQVIHMSTTKNDKDIFDMSEIDKMIDEDDIDVDNNDDDDDDDDDGNKNNAKSNISSANVNDDIYEADVKFIPPPRVVNNDTDANGNSNKVDINFTPRMFPTPMRESKQAEEEDWIAKNRRHLKKHGKIGNNVKRGNGGIDISEEDPNWLKAKGDDFFRMSDYKSALNAYSSAIDIDEQMVSCYSNRSACYLKLHMHSECRYDCIEGIRLIDIELSNDGSSSNSIILKNILLKLLARKATCNCQLGLYEESLVDFVHAKYISNDITTSAADMAVTAAVSAQALNEDIVRIELIIKVETLKKEGDAVFADRQVNAAIEKYTEALALLPVHVGCLSNRSACKITLQDFVGCIDDCSKALDLLRLDMTPKLYCDSDINVLNSILPVAGSEKRRDWVIKTMVRRGAAYAQLMQYDEAVADYGNACGLNPENKELISDLNKLKNLKESKRL